VDSGGCRTQGPFAGAVYGAVDLGSHNCRMLIARVEDQRRCRIIGSFSRAVRLGEGAHRRVRECFLGPVTLLGYARLIERIDQPVPTG